MSEPPPFNVNSQSNSSQGLSNYFGSSNDSSDPFALAGNITGGPGVAGGLMNPFSLPPMSVSHPPQQGNPQDHTNAQSTTGYSLGPGSTGPPPPMDPPQDNMNAPPTTGYPLGPGSTGPPRPMDPQDHSNAPPTSGYPLGSNSTGPPPSMDRPQQRNSQDHTNAPPTTGYPLGPGSTGPPPIDRLQDHTNAPPTIGYPLGHGSTGPPPMDYLQDHTNAPPTTDYPLGHGSTGPPPMDRLQDHTNAPPTTGYPFGHGSTGPPPIDHLANVVGFTGQLQPQYRQDQPHPPPDHPPPTAPPQDQIIQQQTSNIMDTRMNTNEPGSFQLEPTSSLHHHEEQGSTLPFTGQKVTSLNDHYHAHDELVHSQHNTGISNINENISLGGGDPHVPPANIQSVRQLSLSPVSSGGGDPRVPLAQSHDTIRQSSYPPEVKEKVDVIQQSFSSLPTGQTLTPNQHPHSSIEGVQASLVNHSQGPGLSSEPLNAKKEDGNMLGQPDNRIVETEGDSSLTGTKPFLPPPEEDKQDIVHVNSLASMTNPPGGLIINNTAEGTAPLPPVVFNQTHSIPSNLNNAASDVLTNANYVKHSLTNADWPRPALSASSSSTHPTNSVSSSNEENTTSLRTHSSLPDHVTNFSIGPPSSISSQTTEDQRAVVGGNTQQSLSLNAISSVYQENSELLTSQHSSRQTQQPSTSDDSNQQKSSTDQYTTTEPITSTTLSGDAAAPSTHDWMMMDHPPPDSTSVIDQSNRNSEPVPPATVLLSTPVKDVVTRKPENIPIHRPPDGQGQPVQSPLGSLPPSLATPPRVHLDSRPDTDRDVPMTNHPSSSLHCSSTSAFSKHAPASLGPNQPPANTATVAAPPPVLKPSSQVDRNQSLTNAGIQQSSSAPLYTQEPVKPSSSQDTTTTTDTRSSKDHPTSGSRTVLAGQERPPDMQQPQSDQHYKDQEYHERRDYHHDQHRYYQDQDRDDYYNTHQYPPDDRPYSRSAYPYDYTFSDSRGYYGRDYRDDRRYNSYYDDRDHRYWQRQGYYPSEYDHRYQSHDPRQDPRYQDNYREHPGYYQDYYYADDRRRSHDDYPPPPPDRHRSHSRQHYHDNVPPPDESAIYGHNESYSDNQESYYQQTGYDHHESTRIDQGVAATDYEQQDDPYGAGQYPPDVGERYPIEGYRQGEEEQFRPIQATPPRVATPPSPVRETPLPFAYPHVSVRFGIGGHLVTVVPTIPSEYSTATVEIHSLKDLIPQASQLADRTSVLPGPLIPGDTGKNSVIRYINRMSEESSRESENPDLSSQKRDMAGDDALLWRFLALLCQQNGVLVSSDISELLTMESNIEMSKSPGRGVGVGGVKEAEKQEDALNDFRQFLLSGRRKDALELACKRSLWGHALMLSSRMDDQSRAFVVNKFTASLPFTDPLNTFYTMMLGRMPSVVRPEGIGRAGDWKCHLAMVIANNQDKSSVRMLGDSLLSQGRVHAAHLCYHLSGSQIGSDDYMLLGLKKFNSAEGELFIAEPEDLCRTEILEYALGLSRTDFNLPSFQKHKLFHAIKLFESGLLEKSLKYCESISYYVSRDVRKYNQTFLSYLQELSTRLHYASCPLGVMETELPSWLIQLEQVINDSVVDNPTPPVTSRDISPSLVSAGNLVANQYTSQEQPFGVHLQVPQGGTSSIKESENPGSQTNFSQTYTPVNTQTTEGQGFEQQYENQAQYGNQTHEQQYGNQTQYENQTHEQQYGNQTHEQQYGNQTHEQQYGTQTHELQYGNQESTDHYASGQQQNPLNNECTYNNPHDGNFKVNQVTEETPSNSNQVLLPDSTNNGGNQLTIGGTSWAIDQQQQPGDQGNQQHFGAVNTQQLNDSPQYNQPTGFGLMNDGYSNTQGDNNPPIGPAGFGFSDDYSNAQDGSNLAAPQGNGPPLHDEGDNGMKIAGGSNRQSPAIVDSQEKKDDEKKEKTNEPDDSKQNQSGWLGGIFKWMPKGKPRAHLPKDKDKRIIFDKEKNKWVNLDADDTEDSRPSAPPTDNELIKQKPSASTTSSNNQTDGPGPTAMNQYARTRVGKGGRLGARSMYVDVLNPGGTTQQSNTKGPAPPPSLMPSMGPSGPMQMNPSNFFFSDGSNVNDGSSSNQPVQVSHQNEPMQPQSSTSSQRSSVKPPVPPLQQIGGGSTPTYKATPHEEEPPKSAGSSTSIEFGEQKEEEQPQPAPLPQFFNPNTFSSGAQMPGMTGRQLLKRDPFPDNVSEVSEHSLEVSKINKQSSARSRPRYHHPPMGTAPTGPSSTSGGVRPPQYPLAQHTTTAAAPNRPMAGQHQQQHRLPNTEGNWL